MSLTNELRRLSAKHGEGNPATIPPLHNLAVAWAALAQAKVGHPDAKPYFDEAITLYRELLRLRLPHRKPGDKQIPDTRWELAQLLAADYRYHGPGGALGEGRTCVTEMQECPSYGPDHPHTLVTRHSLAEMTGEAGRTAQARDLYAALLPDMERVLGPDHPDTLSTRHDLANFTGKADEPAAACDLLAALLPDMERVLGPADLKTLVTRTTLARWIQRTAESAL